MTGEHSSRPGWGSFENIVLRCNDAFTSSTAGEQDNRTAGQKDSRTTGQQDRRTAGQQDSRTTGRQEQGKLTRKPITGSVTLRNESNP
jgi:hypothetical protein